MTARFDVLCKYDLPVPKEMRVAGLFQTLHFKNSRIARFGRVQKEIGFGFVIRACVVDRGHANGQEVHVITDTGIVAVFNRHTESLITILVARPQQIKRYYAPFGDDVPEALMTAAYNNTVVKHLNR